MEELQNSLKNFKNTFIRANSGKNYNEQLAILKNYLDIFIEGIALHLSIMSVIIYN